MKQKISITNIKGQLSRSEMKKLSGGGGYCAVNKGCDIFNPCSGGYCWCNSGMCMTITDAKQVL